MESDDPEMIVEAKVNKTIQRNIAQVISKAIGYAIECALNDLVEIEDEP